jgi:biotin synthase
MLSRVVWPVFQTADAVHRIAEAFGEGKIRRVCVQALNYPAVQGDVASLARRIRSLSDVPISVSCQPLKGEDMAKLAEAGVNRISIALDAVTAELFEKVKGASISGPYRWDEHFAALEEAVRVFGRGAVTTHLIAGLGENEAELVSMIQRCVDLGVYPALFAFTPIAGTAMATMPPPSLGYYRRAQLAHYLVTCGMKRFEEMKFRDGCFVDFGLPNVELRRIIRTGAPFRTSGCPDCNRPYYNERPGGSMYNYPRPPTAEETAEIERQMGL